MGDHYSSDKPLAFIGALLEEKEQALKDSEGKLRKRLLESAAEEQLASVLGPTKDFPTGKIVPHDEGGLMFGITIFNGRLIFDFGKPIRSIGFTREGALELAELIRQRALQCPPVITRKERAG